MPSNWVFILDSFVSKVCWFSILNLLCPLYVLKQVFLYILEIVIASIAIIPRQNIFSTAREISVHYSLCFSRRYTPLPTTRHAEAAQLGSMAMLTHDQKKDILIISYRKLLNLQRPIAFYNSPLSQWQFLHKASVLQGLHRPTVFTDRDTGAPAESQKSVGRCDTLTTPRAYFILPLALIPLKAGFNLLIGGDHMGLVNFGYQVKRGAIIPLDIWNSSDFRKSSTYRHLLGFVMSFSNHPWCDSHNHLISYTADSKCYSHND